MRIPRPRITIGRLSFAIAIVALVLAIAIEVPPTINPFMVDRGIRLGAGSYEFVVGLLTLVIAAPLIAAASLTFNAVSRGRIEGRLPVRRLLAAAALFGVGTAIILRPLPLDGLRQAYRVRSGTFVAFYHQYRLWPGRHITPCLEVIALDGSRRTYPIDVGARLPDVDVRINSDRTMVWVVELARPTARSRGVLCSMNLITGEFISTPGPFPAGVSEGGGLPPRWP